MSVDQHERDAQILTHAERVMKATQDQQAHHEASKD